MKYDFPKKYRLRRKGEFLRVERSGRRLVGEWVIINMARASHLEVRLGLTVSKKYGESHERNRFKRIVREGFRQSRHLLPKGHDLNIRPRSGAKVAKMADIASELLSLLGCVQL